MSERELMKESDVHAFGVEIVYKQLVEAGWTVDSADVYADREEHPLDHSTRGWLGIIPNGGGKIPWQPAGGRTRRSHV